jgi:NIPSNAP
MTRRGFMGALSAPLFAAPCAPFVEFQTYDFNSTAEAARFADDYIPRLRKIHPGPVVALSASVASHIPRTLLVTPNRLETSRHASACGSIRARYFELRTYRSLNQPLAEKIFHKSGIHPILQTTTAPNITYLIPFESLAAREKSWNTVAADPDWPHLSADVTEISLYRPLS